MATDGGTRVVGGESLDPLVGTFQPPPSLRLTHTGGAAWGQGTGADFGTGKVLGTSGVGVEGCGAVSANKDWFAYSTSSNRGLGSVLDNALTGYGGLSEVSSAFATPNSLEKDLNSDMCTIYGWSTELELGSFNGYLFDDMTLSQDLTRLGSPQLTSDAILDMPSLVSESQMYRSLSSYNATAHSFGRTGAISQEFKSLEPTTDYNFSYERPSPSWPHATRITRVSESSQSLSYASTNLASALPHSNALPHHGIPISNGEQNMQSRLRPENFTDNKNPLHRSRDFVCGVDGCKMSYHRRAELHRHKKTHSGTKPHACRFIGCDRAEQNGFWRKDHLQQHLRQKHGVSN